MSMPLEPGSRQILRNLRGSGSVVQEYCTGAYFEGKIIFFLNCDIFLVIFDALNLIM